MSGIVLLGTLIIEGIKTSKDRQLSDYAYSDNPHIIIRMMDEMKPIKKLHRISMIICGVVLLVSIIIVVTAFVSDNASWLIQR